MGEVDGGGKPGETAVRVVGGSVWGGVAGCAEVFEGDVGE